MGKRKVVSIKKRFRPQSSLAFFLLFLIVFYIVVLAWGYFAKEHISIYEVNTTDISDDAPLYGFVMRAEEIVNSEENWQSFAKRANSIKLRLRKKSALNVQLYLIGIQ